jgi:hypothetical protein
MKTLAVLQPGYIPWLGFFDQMRQADIFLLYDDVQYDKHGWRNRNRIKTQTGPQWLTVPVITSGMERPSILDAVIDNRLPWARKHARTLRQAYAEAPFLEPYASEFEAILNKKWEKLVDLDIATVNWLAERLGISTPLQRTSTLGVEGSKNERLLKLCQHFGATHYLSGSAARDYLDVPMFNLSGVEVVWQDYAHPVYRQLHGQFVSHLSVLDLLLNEGVNSANLLIRRLI